MIAIRRLYAAALAVLAGVAPAASGDSWWRLETTHPAADEAPTISADGKWLVYTSDRNGLPGLFVRRLGSGSGGALGDKPLFQHPAASASPVFGRRERVAFISTREDALGDVYIGSPNGRNLRRIGTTGVVERNPRFIRGESGFFFERFEVGDPVETVRYIWSNRRIEPVATPPALFAIQPPYPIHSADALNGAALLYADDTDNDGAFDDGDRPSAWELVEGRWRQASLPLLQPRGVALDPSSRRLYVSDFMAGNHNILSTGSNPLRTETNPVAMAERARNIAQQPAPDFDAATTWARAAWMAEPGNAAHLALYLRLLMDAGRYRQVALEPVGTHGDDSLVSALRDAARLSAGDRAAAPAVAARIDAPDIAVAGVSRLAHAEFLLGQGRFRDALATVEPLAAGDDPEMRSRALVLQAQLHARLNMREGIEGNLVGVYTMNGAPPRQREQLARIATEWVAANSPNAPAAAIRLREIAARGDAFKELQARMYLAVGNLLAEAGDAEGASNAYAESARLLASAPGSAAEAIVRQARLALENRDVATASGLYRQLEGIDRTTLTQAGQEAIARLDSVIARQYLDEARAALSVGDPMLALSVYRQLLTIDPRNPAAWRGIIECQATRPELLSKAVREYRDEVRRNKGDALAHYKYGLALSWQEADSRRALDHLTTASELDISVPYFHLARGFVLEQRFAARRGEGSRALAILEDAALAYQQALGLVDEDRDPQVLADATLNSANAALGLSQYFRARELYRRRATMTTAFSNPMTEVLFRWNYGISAFRAAFPMESAEQLRIAEDLVRDLERAGTITQEDASAYVQELTGRRALALMDGRRDADAARLFQRLYDMAPERSMQRVRALRSRALLLIREAETAPPGRRALLLGQAGEVITRAVAEVDGARETQRAASRGGGLLQFNFALPTDAVTGGSDISLSKDDERRLLAAMSARVAELQTDHAAAVGRLQEQIALNPRSTDANRAYNNAARVVAMNRMAAEQALLGNAREALATSIQALSFTRFRVADQEIINGNGATILLAQAAELASENPDATFPSAAGSFWMIGDVGRTASRWDLLYTAAERMRALADPLAPEGNVPLISDPVQLARLGYVQALASRGAYFESLAAIGSSRDSGVSLVDAAAAASVHHRRLEIAAADLMTLATEGPAEPEVARLALLAECAALQAMATHAPADAVQARESAAREFARASGQVSREWLPAAFVAVAANDPLAAERSRQILMAQPVYTQSAEDAPPLAILASLERIQLSAPEIAAAPERAWDVVENWRVAQLRFITDRAEVFARGEEDGAWLAQYRSALGRYRRHVEQLAATSFLSGARARLLQREAELRQALLQVADEGSARALPSAQFHRPTPFGFEQVSAMLEPPFLTEGEPILMVNRRIGDRTFRFVYTPTETRELASGEAPPQGGKLFVLGDQDNLPAGATMVLEGRSLYDKTTRLSLVSRPREAVFPPPATGAEEPTELSIANKLRFTNRIQALGLMPQNWVVAGEPMADVLGLTRGLQAAEVDLVYTGQGTDSAVSARRLALAAWLNQLGVTRATIDGTAWIGEVLDPRRLPGLAADELAVAEASLDRALQSNAAAPTITSLNRVIALKEALGQESDLQIYYGRLAQDLGRLGQWRDAQRAAARRIELLEQHPTDPEEYAVAVALLGDYASRSRDWSGAVDAYNAALALREGQPDEQAVILRDLGITLENASRFDEAINVLNQARSLQAPRDIALALGQDIRIARILRIYKNRYEEAAGLLMSALAIARQENLPDLVAETRINLARVRIAQGDFENAVAILEEMEAAIPPEEYAGQVLLERATIAWHRSDYFDAFRLQQQALQLAEQTGNLPVQVAVHNISGLTSWSLNDLDRALQEFRTGLDQARQTAVAAEIATLTNNIGLVHRSRAEYVEALNRFRDALEVDRAESNRWGQAYALRNIGITHTLAGQPAEAIAPLEQAVELATQIGDNVNLAKALLALADAQAALKAGDAAATYMRALQQARGFAQREVEWRALYGRARLYMAANQLDDARQGLREAVSIVDTLRASLRVQEFQEGFLLDKQDLYDTLVQVEIQRRDYAAALEASEQSRARNFIDLLGNRRIDVSRAQDQEVLDRHGALRMRIEALERRVASAAAEERIPLEEELATARREYSDFLLVLRAENPEIADFVRVDPVTVAELQQLVEPDTRLLIYHVLPESVAVWVLGPRTLDFQQLPIRATDLEATIARTREKLQDFAPVDQELTVLGNQLLAPVLGSLSGVRRVGIVPHRQLHTLPFAPLAVGPGEPLVDRHAIFYTPSASVLRYAIQRRESRGGEGVLAFGNPDRGAAMNLPFAQKEAERLQFDFPSVTLRVGESATESWLREHVQDYAIVHIASHGEYNENNPLFSAIMLSPDNVNDGDLSAEEVFGLSIRADLVALSACQTGLGRVGSGDDIVGLNRAFVYAGTRQLLTSLWRIDDVSTAMLFKYFYRQYGDIDTAESLRQAQLRLKAQDQYRHPAYWGGVILSGDWQ